MQFYLNGYQAGDPLIEDPDPAVAQRPGDLPEQADVLIIGCGPAGLVLAAQLANFPDIHTVVIDRRDGPAELLHTYSSERQQVARELIDFDREFARMFSAPPKETSDIEGEGVVPEEFHRHFVQQGRYTAGVATRYAPSMITAGAAYQHLAAFFAGILLDAR